jgi:hypothetical protein
MSLGNIETGDPQVRPSKVAKGQRVWRWTIVRLATPAQRSRGAHGMQWQRRIVVRCVCGHERMAWEHDVVHGLSTGCRSARCRRAYDEGTMKRIRDDIDASSRRIDELLERTVTEAENLRRLQSDNAKIQEELRKRQRPNVDR